MPGTVMRSLDTPLQAMALDELGQETAHEEGADAVDMMTELQLVNLELVHLIVATGDDGWLGTLL